VPRKQNNKRRVRPSRTRRQLALNSCRRLCSARLRASNVITHRRELRTLFPGDVFKLDESISEASDGLARTENMKPILKPASEHGAQSLSMNQSRRNDPPKAALKPYLDDYNDKAKAGIKSSAPIQITENRPLTHRGVAKQNTSEPETRWRACRALTYPGSHSSPNWRDCLAGFETQPASILCNRSRTAG